MLRKRDSDEIELEEINESSSEEEGVNCKEEQHPLADIKETKTHFQWGKDMLSQPLVRRLIIFIFIFILFLGCFLFVLLPLLMNRKEDPFKCTGDATHLFEPNRGEFALCHRGFEKIRGRLGDGYLMTAENLQLEQVDVDRYVHDDVELTLSYREAPNNHEDGCLSIKWKGPSSQRAPLRDCYNISNAAWFAGHTPFRSSWPLNTSIPLSPFLPNDSYHNKDAFGSVLHPVWLGTRGAAIFVDRKIPLHVSIDFKIQQLCLQSLPYPLLCSTDAEQFTTLEYRVCGFVNVKDAAVHFLSHSDEVGYPPHPPHPNMFRYPIWTTRVKFQSSINQTQLLTYLQDIQNRNFSISNFEIDDGYSQSYGSLDFNTATFPNIASLTRSDHVTSNNVTVTMWVHPFVDYKAPDFDEGLAKGVFYPGGLSKTEALVRWWNGVAAVINFEDEMAKGWFRDRLHGVMDNFSIGSFNFDAGEANYLPECLYYPSPEQNGSFTAQYAQFAAEFGPKVLVRVGHFSQHLPVMIRMVDKSPTWSSDNGLHSVIITALSMGLMGYPFILPDIIGGSTADSTADSINMVGTAPGLELYVRWMQLVTFLPAMQFSIPPWEYEQVSLLPHFNFNVTEHAKQLLTLHDCIVQNYTYKLARDVSTTGHPIIRPLWWIAPDDEQAIYINDQFLIGDDVMVAPIIKEGSTERKIYFPKGTWRSCGDPSEQRYHQAQTETFRVNLTTVLWFVKSSTSCKC